MCWNFWQHTPYTPALYMAVLPPYRNESTENVLTVWVLKVWKGQHLGNLCSFNTYLYVLGCQLNENRKHHFNGRCQRLPLWTKFKPKFWGPNHAKCRNVEGLSCWNENVLKGLVHTVLRWWVFQANCALEISYIHFFCNYHRLAIMKDKGNNWLQGFKKCLSVILTKVKNIQLRRFLHKLHQTWKLNTLQLHVGT